MAARSEEYFIVNLSLNRNISGPFIIRKPRLIHRNGVEMESYEPSRTTKKDSMCRKKARVMYITIIIPPLTANEKMLHCLRLIVS
jgi:hypothetical protein